MVFYVFGLPGRFSQWCEAVVAELVERSGRGTPDLVRADTLEQIAIEAIRTRTSNAIISAGHPGGRLRAAVIRYQRPFIVALDDPRHALLDLTQDQANDFPAAVQQVASGCAALRGLAGVGQALVLSGVQDWSDPVETAGLIARHLNLAIDRFSLGEAAARVGQVARPRSERDAAARWRALAAGERELALGALSPFIDAWADSATASLTWPYRLFFSGDRQQERVTGPIDITGRPRCLLHGPHILILPGSWTLSLTVLFSREALEHEFDVEISADGQLASGMLQPAADGWAELALEFVLDDAVEQPIAIRINSRRAAFDGAIVNVTASLTRSADRAPGHAVIEAPART
jgi:hypothetical protein